MAHHSQWYSSAAYKLKRNSGDRKSIQIDAGKHSQTWFSSFMLASFMGIGITMQKYLKKHFTQIKDGRKKLLLQAIRNRQWSVAQRIARSCFAASENAQNRKRWDCKSRVKLLAGNAPVCCC